MKRFLLILFSFLFLLLSFPLTASAEGEKVIYSMDGDNCATDFLNIDWETATSENILNFILAVKSEFGTYSGKSHYLLLKDLKLTEENSEGAEIYYLLMSQDAWRATDYKKNASDPYITCLRAYQPSIYVIIVSHDKTMNYITQSEFPSWWHTSFDGVWDTEDMILTGDTWSWVGTYYMKDYIEYIYSTEAVESMGISAGYTKPNTTIPEPEEPETPEGEYTGFFGTIIEWLKSIFDNIKSIFDGVKENGTLLSNVADKIFELYNGISSWFDELGINLTKSIENAVNSLGEFIKSLFIPDEDYLTTKKEQLENAFSNLMGFQVSSIEAFFKASNVGESVLVDELHTIKLNGIGNVQFKAFDNKFLLQGINTFKPVIRGFIALMLVFFNMNQLLNVIGQGSITQMLGFSNNSKGGKE